ncbi:DNA-3-methyladenine glycosylase 2 family protein [Halopseudomonas laoshanensis]|uniref:DNA-3-methyladenine glycosylase II n=1 Tax=Halopseudomonas laoshanensis TaxID=2268758 RepID=A0A7V7KYT6_9GAMM|nr:AlkA N-terminal domain-containing protein [Halopseudomonas laoshanensis]KAA0696539.1 DNA-3-methyladenine glycosylase 2 family protein [Halopseudomonas laoshanensis]
MDISANDCYQAVVARDERYDGRFFTCVTSTGIYCRPVCPARAPRFANCRFVATAAAAQEAGFRPCLRCRPESSPSSAAWAGTSAVVSRALALIEAGALDSGSLESLAERVGLGTRQLRRLFIKHLGAAPSTVAQTRRLLLAKQLLHQTRLPMSDVALASGFASIRRFNEAFSQLYGRSPSSLRRESNNAPEHSDIVLLLPYRPPYDWDAMLDFLQRRAIPGMEQVVAGVYQRTIRIGTDVGAVSVEHVPARSALRVRIGFSRLQSLPLIIDRLRRMFDLKADPEVIQRALTHDSALALMLAARPGLRVAGGWDAFEVAVRAILGQQVTVAAGVALVSRLVAQLGKPLEAPTTSGLTRYFPAPEAFDPEQIVALGMPRARAAALANLAQACLAEPGLLERQCDLPHTLERLCALPGIGDWTANYIAMRAMQESDAFLASDVALQRAMAGDDGRPDAKQLLALAEQWRPWRAYAVMHLWAADGLNDGMRKSIKENKDALPA